MKPFFAIFVLFVALLSCHSPTETTPSTNHGGPKSVSIAGASGLYLTVPASTSKSVLRAAADDAAGALQVVGASGATNAAVWEDSNSNVINVNVTKAKFVGNYVLTDYVYSGTNYTGAIDRTTGALTVLPRDPSNWNMIRIIGSKIYYVSNGGLYATDLSNGSDFQYTAASDFPSLNSNGWIHVNSNGNIWFIYTSNLWRDDCFKLFFADGRAPYDFDGNGCAQWIYNYYLQGYNILHGTLVIAENGNDAYAIKFDGTTLDGSANVYTRELGVYPITFNDTALVSSLVMQLGTKTAFDMTQTQALASTGGGAFTHLGPDDTINNSLWAAFGAVVKFSIDSSGIITMKTWDIRASQESSLLHGVDYRNTVTNMFWTGDDLYTGPDYSNAVTSIQHLGLGASGTAAVIENLVTDSSISSWTVAAGQLIYTNSQATYQMDAHASSTPTVYSAIPVTVSGL